MKITIAIVAIFLLFTSANSPAYGWILMTPEFTTTEAEILPTGKWVILELFATVLQCNDRRSSLIRQIAKERRESGVEDHIAAQTTRELRLLWHIYTSSKCVSLINSRISNKEADPSLHTDRGQRLASRFDRSELFALICANACFHDALAAVAVNEGRAAMGANQSQSFGCSGCQ
jgi:hypothetical protein